MNLETFRPLNDLILVQTKDNMTEDEVSEMGIILKLAPNKSVVMDRPTNGFVLKKGNKCKEIKSGDEVFFPIHVGQDIELDGCTYLLMSEEAVLGYRRSNNVAN